MATDILKEEFLDGRIQTYLGDCLEIFPLLEAQGIKADLILSDPPYAKTKCSWDILIPIDKLWEGIKSVRHDTTPVVLFGTEPFASSLRLSNLAEYKYDWVWDKVIGTGFLNAKLQPLRNHELISVFYKKQCPYYPVMTEGHNRKTATRKITNTTEIYGDSVKDVHYDSTSRYPRSIQVFSRDTQKSSLHPTQKPLELMMYLIRTYTKEDDLVIDFAHGSGTTAIACKLLNRRYIGMEKDKDIYGKSTKRIKEHTTDDSIK